MQTENLSVENPWIKGRIDQIVHAVIYLPEWREDFRQEALAHFAKTVAMRPGQTLSWYVQSCKSAIRDRFKQGKSVDSLKRQKARCSLENDLQDVDRGVHTDLIYDSNPLLETSVLDAFETIGGRLSATNRNIFHLLFEGYGVREIARKLRIRHQAVSKSRKYIAATAIEIGILTTGWL